eukprot:NODE_9583_length_1413_cov_4.399689.p1 GENE.NODE_9583_length_1413_cov_4.399689~~NODE_9583_length_1413_cov_4.399689.p1  ORF type:complete len:319 (-),score=103.26 NODE_9583_length_1413_cov_4.399689:304-1260(-)
MPTAGGVGVHVMMLLPWTLGFIGFGAGLAGLGFQRTRYSALLLCTFMAGCLKVGVPQSDRTWRLVQWMDPRSYYAETKLEGHLTSIEKGRSLLLFHPHGILCGGYSWNGCWSEKMRTHAGRCHFFIDPMLRSWNPFFKLVADVHGRLESLKPANVRRCMAAGENVALVPGGFEDATMTKSYEQGVVVRTKLMAIMLRYGLEFGYRVHPVYSFGENELYTTVAAGEALRLKLNNYNLPGVIFCGTPIFPLFPRTDGRIITYVGKPLLLPQIARPTAEDIEHWTCEYEQALLRLFNEFRAEAGYPDAELMFRTVARKAKL